MKTKETWIDETLNSLDGIDRATAPPDLFLKIQNRIEHRNSKPVLPKLSYYMSVAAVIAVLIMLNFFCVLVYQHAQSRAQDVPTAVATDYLSYLGPIKL